MIYSVLKRANAALHAYANDELDDARVEARDAAAGYALLVQHAALLRSKFTDFDSFKRDDAVNYLAPVFENSLAEPEHFRLEETASALVRAATQMVTFQKVTHFSRG